MLKSVTRASGPPLPSSDGSSTLGYTPAVSDRRQTRLPALVIRLPAQETLIQYPLNQIPVRRRHSLVVIRCPFLLPTKPLPTPHFPLGVVNIIPSISPIANPASPMPAFSPCYKVKMVLDCFSLPFCPASTWSLNLWRYLFIIQERIGRRAHARACVEARDQH